MSWLASRRNQAAAAIAGGYGGIGGASTTSMAAIKTASSGAAQKTVKVSLAAASVSMLHPAAVIISRRRVPREARGGGLAGVSAGISGASRVARINSNGNISNRRWRQR